MVSWSPSFMSGNSNFIALEKNSISDCRRLVMAGCWRLSSSSVPHQREGHWSETWLIVLAKMPCPSTGADNPISAWHSMKSFLLTWCLGVQPHVSLQIWCGDFCPFGLHLKLCLGHELLGVWVTPCSEEGDVLPGQRSSQLKRSTSLCKWARWTVKEDAGEGCVGLASVCVAVSKCQVNSQAFRG